MKRILALILTITVIFTNGFSTYAVSNVNYTNKPPLSSLSYEECLLFLENNKIEIPPQLKNIDIKKVIEILETNPDYASGISWSVSADFFKAVSKAIQEYYGPNLSSLSTFGLNSTLENSTLYAWDEKPMRLYNCYSYALDITSEWYDPGDFCGGTYDVNDITLSDIEPLVIADLQSDAMEEVTGNKYTCILSQTNNRPIALGNWDNIIALRTDEDYGLDYHFAKLSGTDWLHKPGETAILKFNNPPSISTD